MIKFSEISKNPKTLSLWLDAKLEKIAPSCLPLIEYNGETIPKYDYPKGVVHNSLVLPATWNISKKVTEEAHALKKTDRAGAWLYPNVARDIANLNNGKWLSKQDIEATFKARGIKLLSLEEFQDLEEQKTRNPEDLVIEYPFGKFLLEVYGSQTITWAELLNQKYTLVYTLQKDPEFYLDAVVKDTTLTDTQKLVMHQLGKRDTGPDYQEPSDAILAKLRNPELKFYHYGKPSPALIALQIYKDDNVFIDVHSLLQGQSE
jgi:hypothetical protein